MVNRRYLRTKVMQAIFAHSINDKENLIVGENKLTDSIHNCYKLFLYFLSLFPELRYYRLNKMEELKGKINPSYEDLHPNTKFVDNVVIAQIEDNVTLKRLWTENKINWTLNKDMIVQLFQEISNMEEYVAYMQKESRSYEDDKNLVLTIMEKYFAENTLLHWFFEEQNPHWFDDYNEALLMAYKNVEQFKVKDENRCKITPLFKNEEDITFYLDLYRKTLMNQTHYFSLIEGKLQNWEAERVMALDMILMEMAICELTEFPTIPVKVIINEYIELGKTYSSAKSGVFINGILDRIIVDLKAEGKINKMGRGLIDN